MKLKVSAIIICSACLLFFGAGVFAQTTQTEKPDVGADLPRFSNPFTNPNLSVSIPGFTGFRSIFCEPTNGGKGQNCYVPWLADYIKALYTYGIGSLIILAVIVMMIGGVVWLTAAGNEQRISDAKQWINGSLFGIVIAVSSYMILTIINPALTNLSPIKLATTQNEDLPTYQEYESLIEEIKSGEVKNDVIKSAPKNIIQVEVETIKGKRKIQVDETIAEASKKAFLAMKNAGYSVTDISDYRPGSKFCHGLGLALDINYLQNYCPDCYGEKKTRVGNYWHPSDNSGAGKDYTADQQSMTKKIIEIWTNAGWCWGGNWKTNKDYMHFSTTTCRNGAECGNRGTFDFGKSVKHNHQDLGITYPCESDCRAK